MRSTLQFILKFKNLLFFAGLQIVAFYMLINTQGFHQTVFMESTGDVVGRIETFRNRARSYLHLNEENAAINDQLTRVLKSAPSSYIPTAAEMEDLTPVDSATMRKYQYTAAQVVNRRTTGRANFFTLDRGTDQGVKPSMGVLAGGAIVGFIKDVSDNYSVVLPVIHTDFSTSVRLKADGTIATLKWTGGDIAQAEIPDFPRHLNPQAGDTIVTTAYSTYFPPDMFVGTVNQVVPDEAGAFQRVLIDLAVDYNRLNYVQVVENVLLEERLNLEQEVIGDD